MSENKTALIVGATGLTGGYCLRNLLKDDHYGRVTALTRSPIPHKNPKLHTIQIDFDRLSNEADLFDAHDVFCCLGTTIAKAGSRAAFRKVDFSYPLAIAEKALAAGAHSFSLISSMGANHNSRIFYNRVKGEIESAISKLGYNLVLIYRPSLLTGSRSEVRFGENIGEILMGLINPVLIGSLKKYRPIPAETVALTMTNQVNVESTGRHIFESDIIVKLSLGTKP